jgi:hypothetical protein
MLLNVCTYVATSNFSASLINLRHGPHRKHNIYYCSVFSTRYVATSSAQTTENTASLIVAYPLPGDVFAGPLCSNGCPSTASCALVGTCLGSNGVYALSKSISISLKNCYVYHNGDEIRNIKGKKFFSHYKFLYSNLHYSSYLDIKEIRYRLWSSRFLWMKVIATLSASMSIRISFGQATDQMC